MYECNNSFQRNGMVLLNIYQRFRIQISLFIFYVFLLFLFSSLFSIPMAGGIPVVSDSGYFVKMELQVDFDTTVSGEIYLFFGTTEKDEMEMVGPENVDNVGVDNDVLTYVWNWFFMNHSISDLSDENMSAIISGILDPGKTLIPVEPNITFYCDGKNVGVALISGFEVNHVSSKMEYTYLEFMHHEDLADDAEFGKWKSKYWDDKDYVRMNVKIRSHDPISMTFSEESIDHRRTRKGECMGFETTYIKFIMESNRIQVHDSFYKSPSFVYKIFFVTVLLGYPALIIIWLRNRFRGRGLILPMVTLAYSIFIWVGYYFPGLSLYDLGGITYHIIAGAFILMVISCHFINPKPGGSKGYEEMKKEEGKMEKVSKIKIPMATYIRTALENRKPLDGRDEYEILTIERGASVDEIKKAYIERIKEYHPDKYQDAPEKIKEAAEREASLINEAYENLMKAHNAPK